MVPSPWLWSAAGKSALELLTRADLELVEDLAQVVLDRMGADEQLCADLRVGVAVAGEIGDLCFPGSEVRRRVDGPLARPLPGRTQLASGARGECFRAHCREHLPCPAQLFAGVDSPTLPSEPFAVEEVSARNVRGRAAAAESIDCLPMQLLGNRVVTHERTRPRLHPKSPVRSAALCAFGEPPERTRRDHVLAATCSRFDELGEDPAAEAFFTLARVVQQRERVPVAAEAVGEDRSRVPAASGLRSVSVPGRVLNARLERGPLRLVAAPGREQQGCRHDASVACRGGDCSRFVDQRRRAREVAVVHLQGREVVERDRQQHQQAGIASELDVTTRESVCCLVVPELRRGAARECEPAKIVLLLKGLHGAAQRRQGGGIPVGEQRSQPVEERVERARDLRRRWCGARCFRRLDQTGTRPVSPTEQRRFERLQVRLARQRNVEALEHLGGAQEPSRRIDFSSRQRDAGSQQLQLRMLELGQRPGARGRQEIGGGVRRAGFQLGVGGAERSSGAGAGFGREESRSFEERGRGRLATALPCSVGRAFEVVGDVGAGHERRVRVVPRSPIRMMLGIDRLRERHVDAPAVVGRSVTVDGRSQVGMHERDALAESEQPVGRREVRRAGVELQQRGRAPQQGRIALGVRSRDEQQLPRVGRKPIQTRCEALGGSVGGRSRGGHGETSGELCRRQGVRQLEERAWISLRLGDDAIANSRIERAGNDRREERARVRVRQTLDDKLGQSGELVAGFAHPEDQCDPLGAHSARHEGEHLGRRLVEQMRVVDHADQRPVRGNLGKQSQRGQSEEEPIRRAPCADAEGGTERLTVRSREPVDTIRHLRAQTM